MFKIFNPVLQYVLENDGDSFDDSFDDSVDFFQYIYPKLAKMEYPDECYHSDPHVPGEKCFILYGKETAPGGYRSIIKRNKMNWLAKDYFETDTNIYPGSGSHFRSTSISLIATYDSSFRSSSESQRIIEILNNTSTEQLVVRHLCGCGACCEPTHLRIGTQQENINDQHYHHILRRINNWEDYKLFREKFLYNNKKLI